MITICANCHCLIRLIPDRPAAVSHGICPACIEKLYGKDLADRVRADMLDNSKTLAEVNARRGF